MQNIETTREIKTECEEEWNATESDGDSEKSTQITRNFDSNYITRLPQLALPTSDPIEKLRQVLNSMVMTSPLPKSANFSGDLTVKELSPTNKGFRRIRFLCPIAGCKVHITVYIVMISTLKLGNFRIHLKYHESSYKHLRSSTEDFESDSRETNSSDSEAAREVKFQTRNPRTCTLKPNQVDDSMDEEHTYTLTSTVSNQKKTYTDLFEKLRIKLMLMVETFLSKSKPLVEISTDFEIQEIAQSDKGYRRFKCNCPITSCNVTFIVFVNRYLSLKVSSFKKHLEKHEASASSEQNVTEFEPLLMEQEEPDAKLFKKLREKLNSMVMLLPAAKRDKVSQEYGFEELEPSAKGCRRVKCSCPIYGCNVTCIVFVDHYLTLKLSSFKKHLEKHEASESSEQNVTESELFMMEQEEPDAKLFKKLREKLNSMVMLLPAAKRDKVSQEYEFEELEPSAKGCRRVKCSCPINDCNVTCIVFVDHYLTLKLSSFKKHLEKHEASESSEQNVTESELFMMEQEEPDAKLFKKLREKLNSMVMLLPAAKRDKVSQEYGFEELEPSAKGCRRVKCSCPINSCNVTFIVFVNHSLSLKVSSFKKHLEKHGMDESELASYNSCSTKSVAFEICKAENFEFQVIEDYLPEDYVHSESYLSYLNKCRLCLNKVELDCCVELSSLMDEKFVEFFGRKLIHSKILSTKICMACDSIMSNFTEIKKVFIENQEKLDEFLPMSEENISLQTEAQNNFDITKNDEEINKIKNDDEVIEDADKFTSFEPYSDESSLEDSFIPKPKKTKVNKFVKTSKKPKETALLMCHICSFQTKHSKSFDHHLRAHVDYKIFDCDLCEYRSKTKEQLFSHMKVHLPNDDPRVRKKCTFEGCEATFRFSSSVKRHISGFHLNQKPFECSFCSKRLTSKSALKRHIKFVHENYLPEKVFCDRQGCKASFSSKSHLSRHKKNVHKIK